MKNLYILSLILAALCLASFDVQAQANSRRAAKAAMRAKSRAMSNFTVKRNFGKSKQYASVGAYLGASNYFGDLAPRTRRMSTSIRLTRSYLGFFYAKRINANFSWRASLAWARLRGDDFNADQSTALGRGRYNRNLNFRNDIIEFSGVAMADVFPTDRGYLRRDFFNAYGLLGLGIFYHNPKGYVPTGLGLSDEGTWVPLRPLGTEGQGLTGYKKKYGRIQPTIMLGGGVKYRVSDKLDLGLEFAWRFTFTDYLDDVSGNFVADQDAQQKFNNDATSQEAKLWYVMSNKSGLATGGSNDENRSFKEATPSRFEVLQPDGSWVAVNNSRPDQVRRLPGYGIRKIKVQDPNDPNNPNATIDGLDTGSPRGLGALDGYTVTTLSATYILEFRARTPKFR